jgi:hypothetical protein
MSPSSMYPVRGVRQSFFNNIFEGKSNEAT